MVYKVKYGFAIKYPKKWDFVKKAWEFIVTDIKNLNKIAGDVNICGLKNPV